MSIPKGLILLHKVKESFYIENKMMFRSVKRINLETKKDLKWCIIAFWKMKGFHFWSGGKNSETLLGKFVALLVTSPPTIWISLSLHRTVIRIPPLPFTSARHFTGSKTLIHRHFYKKSALEPVTPPQTQVLHVCFPHLARLAPHDKICDLLN